MLTHEELTQILDYNPETGDLLWKAPRRKVRVGAKAGHLHHKGYINLEIDGKHYAAHRLVWMYKTGKMPSKMIDHINGNRADNRFENLREATNGQNRANSKTNSKHGVKGVRLTPWVKEGGRRWEARITVDRKTKHLGCFFTKEEAHKAYQDAAQKFHGAFAKF